MKVTSVKATWVHVPIQHVSDFGRIASFDSVIVKVETDGDLVGWGEAKAGVDSAASAHGLAAIINQNYAPLLVGQDPRDVSRLWDVLYNTPREGYAVERGHVLPQSIDVMKRLASRSTWWHRLPHKSYTRSTPQRGEASHGLYWH